MRPSIVLLTILMSLPMGLIATRAVTVKINEFNDPCLHWGASASGSASLTRAAKKLADPCRGRFEFTSDSKTRALFVLLIVPGGILIAIILAIWGAIHSGFSLMITGSLIMLFETIPLVFGFAPLAFLTAIGFFLAAWRVRSTSKRA